MSQFLKSNSLASPGVSIGTLGIFGKTAVELYADYAARVTADGGIVTSPAAAQAAIQAALNGNYYLSTNFAYSAQWGVRLTGSAINKIYSLVGLLDAFPTGAVNRDTTTFSYATAHFTTSLSYILTPSVLLAKGANYALAFAARPASAAQLFASIEGSPTLASYPALVQTSPLGGIDNVAARDTAGTLTTSTNEAVGATIDSNMLFLELDAKRLSYIRNALTKTVYTTSLPLIDARLISRKFMLNGLAGTDGGTNSICANGRMAEAWALHTATADTAAKLSFDQYLRCL